MNRQFAADLETDLARGHVLEWAELYALDAISAEERRAIDAFVEDAAPAIRDTFADRVRTCRETVTAAYASDQVDPPADLFERIMDRLPGGTTTGSSDHTRGPAVLRSVGSTGSPLTPDPGTETEDLRTGQEVGADELSQRRSARASVSSRAARWVVAAAAAVVLAVGGVTIAQNLQQTSLEEQILEASDVRTEQLALRAGGTADLAVSTEEDAAVVTLTGVPAPADGFVYQMWRIPADGAAPISVGTMTGEDVAGSKVTELPGIGGTSAIALTVEPEGGSEIPTLPIVAQIPLGA
ncbi:Regulator of sigK [Arthrobacter agilis]|uniref:anti-sigma factor n=1 Tax=Arthrobacter agilis TaxID=37921 RepID=UPI000F6E6D6F|nr:anti-sigma factor [Arthrobacter agilis]VDR32760.1 Regulator of sigK [Arthrobacter agilis]